MVMRHSQVFPPCPPPPTLYLGPALPPSPPLPWLQTDPIPDDIPDWSGISALSSAGMPGGSAQLDPHETSLPERPGMSYNDLCRGRDLPEWNCVRRTMKSLFPLVSDKRMYRFERCLDRAYFYRNKTDGKVAVFSSACRDRFCPVCAGRRSFDVSRKVTEWIAGHHDVRFVTLTLRSNDVPLELQVSALYKAFTRLRRDKRVRESLAAGIWFFQTTFNTSTGRWHPHLHCITVGSYLSKEILSETWLSASGDSYIVDIRYVRDPGEVACYVARYAARPYRLIDLPADKRGEALLAFMSRRLFGTWGKLESRPKVKRPKADLSSWECVGSWSYVTMLQADDWRAASIMLAWQSRSALDPGVSIYEVDHAIANSWVREIDIDPPPPG
jgi:hypothetical protein